MSPAAKSNRQSIHEDIDKQEIRHEAANLFMSGVERIAELQKQFIDIAVQHNKETVEVMKKTSAKTPFGPKASMMDFGQATLDRYADLEKSAVDFLVEQNRIWMDAFNDRTGTVKKSGESVVGAVKQAIENSFAVQKKALEHTAAQTKAVMNAARDQFGLSGTQAEAMTDTFRRGVDTIVEAQKELLNIAIH